MLFIKNLPYYTGNVAEVYFQNIRHWPYAVWLDSCFPQLHYGQYDILSANPIRTICTRDFITEITETTSQHKSYSRHCPILLLQEFLNCDWPQDLYPELPFTTGGIGYCSYDLVRLLEKIEPKNIRDIDLPEMQWGHYSWAIIVDHAKQQVLLIADQKYVTYQEFLNLSQHCLKKNILIANYSTPFKLTQPFVPTLDRETYTKKFQNIINYIYAGDCYQINFAQRFEAAYKGDPWQAYCVLRQKNPAPFSAFLQYPDFHILSLSPERFLKMQNQWVETKPIKGTKARGKNPKEDEAQRLALSHSVKDQAENLMIVDLLRNDLGRHCEFGSIEVQKLFDIESFPAVHHLVSTIRGKLARPYSSFDLLKSAFPGGSITGAPKIRAMQIIEESESVRRGIYCGNIAYIDKRGFMDSNIAIRTLLFTPEKLYCYAGGGIVADSKMEEEYQECFDKISLIAKTLAEFTPY